MVKTIEELNKVYDLELDKVVANIKKLDSGTKSQVSSSKIEQTPKLVLLQFPDGLKQVATAVVDFLEKKTNAEFMIWLDTCYGACDSPVLGKELEKKIDLMIQFGHNKLMPSY